MAPRHATPFGVTREGQSESRQNHSLEIGGSTPPPATNEVEDLGIPDSVGVPSPQPIPQEAIRQETFALFKEVAVGKVIGKAIAAAYADERIRSDTAFMEWITKPGTTIWSKLEVMGILRLDPVDKVVKEV